MISDLKRSQGFDVVDGRLREDDDVVGVGSPQLHKVGDVAEPQAGMPTEHDAGLPVV